MLFNLIYSEIDPLVSGTRKANVEGTATPENMYRQLVSFLRCKDFYIQVTSLTQVLDYMYLVTHSLCLLLIGQDVPNG